MGAAVNLQNTTTHNLAFVWIAPQADTITGFKFKLTAVVLVPGVLECRAETVSTTTGLNTGTVLGTSNNAKVSFTPVAGDIGVYHAVFSESFAVAQGDLVAFVVKPLSGTWDASNYVSLVYRLTGVESMLTPYPINNGAVATHGLQQIIVVGADRSYECCLLSTGATANLTSGGTPNEVGTYFTVPTDCTTIDCFGLEYGGNVTGSRSLDVLLYDSGTSVLASKTYNTTSQLVAGAGRRVLLFTSKVALSPGGTYHVAIKSTHASGSTTVYQHTWASAADKAAYLSGVTAYHAERSGGAWTYDTAKLSCVFPLFANRAVSGGGLSAPRIGPGLLVRAA